MFNNNPPLANSNTATTLANPTSPVFGNDGFLFVIVLLGFLFVLVVGVGFLFILGVGVGFFFSFLFVTETFIISPFSLISKVYSVSYNTYPSGAVISW